MQCNAPEAERQRKAVFRARACFNLAAKVAAMPSREDGASFGQITSIGFFRPGARQGPGSGRGRDVGYLICRPPQLSPSRPAVSRRALPMVDVRSIAGGREWGLELIWTVAILLTRAQSAELSAY